MHFNPHLDLDPLAMPSCNSSFMEHRVDQGQVTSRTVRDDFNDAVAVAHYTRAAHFLGLWKSERAVIERFLPDRGATLLEAGCGAGRASIGLWDLGYRRIVAFDFASELVAQARHLAETRAIPTSGMEHLTFLEADATELGNCHVIRDNAPKGGFDGTLFLFNGLMQIPGRSRRREALAQLKAACRPGAPVIFTTHDRDYTPAERVLWRLEADRWRRGEQDSRLLEFGDRYFEDEAGRTFMHLPDRQEILEDIAASGLTHRFDAMRKEIAPESPAVRDFSDECRFWVAST
jgi:SAM-dependent methyltransferase